MSSTTSFWRRPQPTRGARALICSALMFLLDAASWLHAAESLLVYVGTYTDRELLVPTRANAPGPRSEGIYAFRLDPATGKLESLGLAAASANPTYVTFSADGKFLYATNEVYRFRGADAGAVSAFAIDTSTGRLRFLNQESARGTGTCHASIDHTGRVLLAANFGGGSVVALPVAADGSLRPASDFEQDVGSGPNPRQAGPHSHSINVTPDNQFAVAAEFGTDRLRVFRLDPAAGLLTPAEPAAVNIAPASAPRHTAFHPDGRTLFVLNEISSTLTALRYAPGGGWSELQTVSALPADFTGRNTSAEVVVHPNGKFVYASNRGHHSIAVFAVAPDGRLRAVAHVPCGGRTPRGFAVDPSGRWLIAAHQDTHAIAVFAIDAVTGIPKPTGESAPVHTPVCVKFLAVR